MSHNIEGKVVVITGASSGLGEAAARLLSAQSGIQNTTVRSRQKLSTSLGRSACLDLGRRKREANGLGPTSVSMDGDSRSESLLRHLHEVSIQCEKANRPR